MIKKYKIRNNSITSISIPQEPTKCFTNTKAYKQYSGIPNNHKSGHIFIHIKNPTPEISPPNSSPHVVAYANGRNE